MKQSQTGPQTPLGKARSSMNAIKAGYSSKSLLIPGESAHEWRQHLASVQESYPITTPAQAGLVEEIAMALWQLKRLRRLVEQDVQTVSQLPVARIDMEMSLAKWTTIESQAQLSLTSLSYPMQVDAGMMKYMQQQKIIESIDYWRAYRQGEDIQASELIDLMPEDVRSIFDERARQQSCLIDDYLISELSEQELELIEVQFRTLYRYAKDYLNQHPEDQIKVMHWQSIRARRVYEAYNQVSYQRSLATASRTLARCIQLYQQLGTMHIDQVPCSASVKRLRKNMDVTDVSGRPGS